MTKIRHFRRANSKFGKFVVNGGRIVGYMRTVEDACPYGVGIVRYMRTVRDAGPYVRANTVAPLRIDIGKVWGR